MSSEYYTELWLVTQKDMERLLELDQMMQSTTLSKSKDALNTILPVYLKYRELVNRLIVCHDQMIQPQKRKLIKQVMDCAIGRMLEYNREIVGIESNDYQWPDDVLIQRKITPYDMEIKVPMSYTADRKDILQQRRKYIEDLIDNARNPAGAILAVEESTADVGNVEVREISLMNQLAASQSIIFPERPRKTLEPTKIVAKVESLDAKELKDTQEAAGKAFEAAIRLIQAHERARVGRRIGAQAERIYNRNKRLALGELEIKKYDKNTKNKAATVIQRHWRGHMTRKSIQRRINETEELMNMTIPSWQDKSIFQRDKDNYQRRISLEPEAVTMMDEFMSKERARVFRVRGPGLLEDITDEIREWFLMWYNELGYFDSYPVAEIGGTVLVATGQTLTPDEFAAKKANQDGKSEKGKESASEEKKRKEIEKKKLAMKKLKGGTGQGWTMPEKSKALEGLVIGKDEFIKNWRFRDEKDNNNQQLYLDLINEKFYYELQLEMREIVDELMRLELAKFNAALMKDHAGDNPKFINPTAGKGKKSKKKNKKKKAKKDPLAAMPIEEIFNELVLARIIHNYPEVHLDNWQGDLSYQNYEAQLQSRDFQYRCGEIKESIMKYCVLPLGSREVHAISPLIRSVCICGLPGHGKSLLANAICTEVGALLFDLTPSVLVGQYEGKKNQEFLMKMIGKIARVYAPSIIFIDGGEKPWMKKIPPAEKQTQPKRFAKLLPKFVKTIKPGDQILFLTLATEPYKASKAFIKIHNKFIIIPSTDYNTLYMFYKNLLMTYHGVDRNFNVSCLAKVSVGYPLGIIREAVEKVMNVNRIITLKSKPLDPQEILSILLTYELPSPKIVEQFKNFETRKTPLGKNRMKMLESQKNESDNSPPKKKK